MFIVTFSIILRLNQVASMNNRHVNSDIMCSSDMMKDLYSRIHISPLIFLAKVLRKEKIPYSDSNWQLVTFVRVKRTLKDIFTPNKLSSNHSLWIGPFTDQINNTLCMTLLKNNSDYIFFATQLSGSKNSFQSLYVPLYYSENIYQKINILLKQPIKPLVISRIPSYNITVEGKIEVQCQAEGYPIPQFFWYKNSNKPILESKYKSRIFYRVEGIKSILHIDNVEKSDEANYTCHAENIYGYVDSSFKLEVRETDESRRKCSGEPNFCIHGMCSKDKVSCLCKNGFYGRRCNYHHIPKLK
uniref:Neuregulin-type 1 n=1 Tax=Schmidtea mediterranea TaxID=79327 RepID=A0A172MAV5_SCHMD|nr:neuregulin-type 1 [Schmidtea mediterranea]